MKGLKNQIQNKLGLKLKSYKCDAAAAGLKNQIQNKLGLKHEAVRSDHQHARA